MVQLLPTRQPLLHMAGNVTRSGTGQCRPDQAEVNQRPPQMTNYPTDVFHSIPPMLARDQTLSTAVPLVIYFLPCQDLRR